ncbi:LysE family translocator [Actinoplanes sp. NPDC051851]|uniref:LysE family translocator n=1 Tax=Actinoplanes sp. NPDC051851 TaxID=3154753 RepID=UPI0034435615
MVSSGQVGGLALACVVLIAVPGPGVLFIIGRALTYGRAAALAGVVGNAVGSYCAAVCVAVGLGPLLERSALLLQMIKWVGALYLLWLGVQALRHAGTWAEINTPSPVRPRSSIRSGAVVGFTNPKTYIVFAAILPQFLDRSGGAIPLQMLVLAVVPVLIGLVLDSTWAVAAARARSWLAHSRERMRTLGRIGAFCMIGLGVSTALADAR